MYLDVDGAVLPVHRCEYGGGRSLQPHRNGGGCINPQMWKLIGTCRYLSIVNNNSGRLFGSFSRNRRSLPVLPQQLAIYSPVGSVALPDQLFGKDAAYLAQ